MRSSNQVFIFLVSTLLLNIPSFSQSISLAPNNLDAVNVATEKATWKGQDAIRLLQMSEGETIAIVNGTGFKNGTIELEVAGIPAASAGEGARGFIGVAFRVEKGEPIRYEGFYLRPTNGRADDQVRRNHSTQYISHPEYSWYKLRQEFPKKYESYVDLVPGEWTKMRVVVKDQRAELYVHDAKQPCLIVNDMKGPGNAGAVALWIGAGTEGYFRNLNIQTGER